MTLSFTLATLDQAAEALLQHLPGHSVCALYGPMGAGKTTLVKALCCKLGVQDMVNSPTFALVNEYAAADGQPIYHLDCYRLKDLSEALRAGLGECLAAPQLCLVEWPEIVEPILPDDTLRVHLSPQPDGSRLLAL